MLSMRSFGWLYLYFLAAYLKMPYVRAAWPSLDSSKIQLLGIFYQNLNITELASRSLHTRAMFKAAILLSQQYNITIDGQFIGWRLTETDGDVMNTFSSTCLQISTSNIVGIVGPTFSREAHVIAPLTEKLGIPVISYAATDPELSDRKVYPTFYRTVSSDNAAALAIAKLFLKFNWTSCVIIYQNDAFGAGGAKVISETFGNNNLTVKEMIVFDVGTLTIRGDLKSLLTSSPTRIVILWAESRIASLILQNALDSNVLGPHFTWILSSNVPLNSFSPIWYEKLTGMLTVEPVVGNVVNAPINSTLLYAAYKIWQKYEPESFPGSDNVGSYALFAFDATWSLIQSLQRLCSTNTSHLSSCISFVNTSFCFDRRFLNSSSFFDQIDNNAFVGVSGPVQFNHNVTDRINGIYYVVNNVQSFSNSLNYVPVLVSSDGRDWRPHTQVNTIIWPGKSLEAPTGYATLSGVTLRIAIIEGAPFTMNETIKDKYGQITQKAVGYIPDLIRNLENIMGFISNITWLPSEYHYNQLIDAVENNVFDMVVGDVTILAARRERVGFSAAIYDNSLRVIVRNVSIPKVDLFPYLNPFSIIVWLLLLCALLLSALLICLYERKENEALISRKAVSELGTSILYTYATMLGYGWNFHIKTVASRLLFVGICFISMVLIATYQANLTSDLTIAKSKSMISGIDDIKNGKVPAGRVGIITASSIEDFYLREISANRNFYPLKSKEDMYDKLLNNIIDVSIMDAGALEFTVSSVYCNLTLVGTDFDHSAFGIVFPKNWLYQQILDVTILSLRESRIFDNLKSKWFKSSYCSHSSETSTHVSIRDMAGIFLLFVVISTASFLFFVASKIYSRRVSRTKSIQQNIPSVNHSAAASSVTIITRL